MVWIPAYSYDPTVTSGPMSGVYTLRRWLGDTDFSTVPTQPGQTIPKAQQSALYADQEYLAYINDKYGDLIYTYSHILRMIAGNAGLLSVYVSLGPGGTVDFSKMPDVLNKTAREVEDAYARQPASMFAEIDSGAISAWRVYINDVLRSMG